MRARAVGVSLLCLTLTACGAAEPDFPVVGAETPVAAGASPTVDPAPLRAVVEAMADAGRRGDVATCRQLLSQPSRERFDALFARGGPETVARGWRHLCEAHDVAAWPVDGRVTGAQDRATLRGTGAAGRDVELSFLRKADGWRLDYAVHPDAEALRPAGP